MYSTAADCLHTSQVLKAEAHSAMLHVSGHEYSAVVARPQPQCMSTPDKPTIECRNAIRIVYPKRSQHTLGPYLAIEAVVSGYS